MDAILSEIVGIIGWSPLHNHSLLSSLFAIKLNLLLSYEELKKVIITKQIWF